MARQVANVDIITDTFEIWLLQTNLLLHSLSTEIITANSTVANTGNTDVKRDSQLFGSFGANTIVVTDNMRGGNVVGGFANLVIQSNTIVSNAESTTLLFQVSNSTLSSNVTVNSFKTGIFTGNTIAMSVGANVIANSSAVLVGNTTQNSVITGTSIRVGNSSVNTLILSNSTVSVIDHGGYVRVAGNADFSNTLLVVGAATFSNQVSVSGNLNLSNTTAIIANASPGINGQLLASNGTATYWFTQPAPPVPGGVNTSVTFNDSGAFNGTSGFTFNKATNSAFIANTLSIGGSLTVAGLTTTANVAMANNVLINPQLRSYKEFLTTNLTATGTVNIDLSQSNVFRHVLTGNVTYTLSNPPPTGVVYSITLVVQQDGTGSRIITWPASVRWPGALQPPQTTTANSIDIWNFVTYDGGSTYLGTLSGKDVR